jgi:glutamyl-tRNA synthetase
MSPRVRMAPSPTGFIHIGNLRTALYNEFFARKNKGALVLRMEDTDQSRFVQGAAEAYCRSLKEIGVVPDEGVWIDDEGRLIERGDKGPYLQSKRKGRHWAYAKELTDKGMAYPCFCTEERLKKMREDQMAQKLPTRYDRACRGLDPKEAEKRIADGEPHVIRLAVPVQGSVTFRDEIRGDVTFDWKEMDDQIIIKSDGMPTYHLASTCDDHDMGITHVIRGEEWISSTPKHLFIYRAFGWDVPKFAHLPLLLNADKSKLSKRQGGAAVEEYLKNGYLPEAILNFAALLGWNPTGDREVYSHEELIAAFDLARVNKGGAVVNFKKLDWLNAQYLKRKTDEEFFRYCEPALAAVTDDEGLRRRAALVIRERVQKTADAAEAVRELTAGGGEPDAAILPWKSQSPAHAAEKLEAARELLMLAPESAWTSPASLEQRIKEMIRKNGWENGETLWPLRAAMSGKKTSPPPFDLLYVLGRGESLKRIDAAVRVLVGAG